MATHQAWYPLGRVLSPPELPIYLKNVHELKPIIGVPSDSELIGIHAIIRAASRASDIPGMHDANLNMNLADHLFNAQMARYRSKYSLITFPSDARYTPPALPAHLTGTLEPVHGAPSDDEIIKVQDVLQTYQEFRRIPSMYDVRVNMELSQHLFDLHMARHMRHAGESSSSHVPPTTSAPENYARVEERKLPPVEETIGATNNAGTGSDTIGTLQTPEPTLNVNIREVMERSNQLFERFNQLLEQSTQPAQKANELAERSNEFANRANQLAERLNQSHERSNQLLEQTIKTWEQLGGTLGNINRMLMRIQHAIIRNHKGNAISALDCLVNEKGKTPPEGNILREGYRRSTEAFSNRSNFHLPVTIDGVTHDAYVHDDLLGELLQFYDIRSGLCRGATGNLLYGKEVEARRRLGMYLSSCLG